MAHSETPTDSDRPDDELTDAEQFADRFIDEHQELFDALAAE